MFVMRRMSGRSPVAGSRLRMGRRHYEARYLRSAKRRASRQQQAAADRAFPPAVHFVSSTFAILRTIFEAAALFLAG
jgi:hypothetical protein